MTVLVDCGASQNFVSKAALEQSLQACERLVHTSKREEMIGCLGWRNISLESIGEHAQSEAPSLPLMKSEGSPAGRHAAAASPAQNTHAVVGSPARRYAVAVSPAKRSTAAGSPVCAEAPESPDVDTGAQVCGSKAPEPAPASDSDSTGVHASTSSYHLDGAVLELRTARSRVRINRRGRRKLSARERDSALASVAEETAAPHMIAPSLNAAATSLRAFDRISDPSIDRAHVDVALRRATRSPEANASDEVFFAEFAALHELPSTVEAIVSLEEMSYELFLTDLERDQIREIVVPTAFPRGELCTSSTADESVLESDKQRRFAAQDWDAVKGSPYFDLLWEFKDVFPDKVPSALPVDRGVRHEIDLEPGSKYCVTRQWPLPREQVEAIDEFFAKRALAGHVRESKSPHSSPTFCVRKATGGWRIVHAFNKLNAATIPAQTPIPRKDVLIDSMGGSTVFSALDLMDGFYQILMRESDVPLTAVSTPSGMLWEWLIMPQGLKNAPATFNRLVTHLLRPHRAYAPSYFDDIFVHSRAEGGLSVVDVHKRHLRSVLQCLRDNSLYCNLKKCIFGASEIPILGCYVGKAGVRADPEKIKAIADWPIPKNVKDLRKWLGLANYLHKCSHNYAARVRPLTHLLKKDVEWDWTNDVMNAFIDVKESLVRAPVLALPDHTKAFSVVCDASDFAIGCALMQKDDDDHERVVSYQSRLLKAAEKNYPVHDKELLAIKYALLKFRVHLLGATPFVVYTDHASLRTAINSPHLSQRMARWLAFFSEFNFRVEYKPGKENVLADALSRRPDYESSVDDSSDALCLERTPDLMHLSISRVQTKLKDNIQSLYAKDDECRLLLAHFDGSSKESLPAKLESKLARLSYHDGLLWHRLSNFDYPRVYVPHDQDLKLSILHEFHDAPASGHLGREKTFLQVSNVFWWPHQYTWVANYVRSCEQCQRVKPAGKNKAPLHLLPIPQDCWKSVSMDFVFGFPEDKTRNTGVVVFVDRLSKMVHVVPVRKHVTAQETAPGPAFYRELFRLLGTDLALSTADHPETDGQTERVNRVVEDILRSIAVDHPRDWSRWLPYAEFAINSSEHASTAVTPFYFNSLRHLRVPATLFEGVERSAVGGQLAALDASARSPSPDVASTAHVDARDAPPVQSRSESVTVLPDSTQSIDMSGTVLSYGTRVSIDGSPTVLSYGTRAKNSQSQTESGDCSCERQPRKEGRAVSHTGAEIDLSAARAARATKKQDKAAAAARQFVDERAALLRRVRDQLAAAQDKQKLYADKSGRKNKQTFCVGDKVLLSIKNPPNDAVTTLPSGSKLLPRFIRPYTVVEKIGDLNYKLDLPTRMATHPVFYVGLLKRYHDATVDSYPSAGARRSHQGAQTPPIETRARCASTKASSLAERTSRGSASRGHGTPPASDELPSAPSQALSPSASTARFRPDIAGEGYGRLAVAPQKTMRSREPSEPPHLVQPPMLKRSRAPPVPLIDKQGERHYHVERLLRVQRRKGNTHYLVKWRGYDVSQSSWEPAERLREDVPDLVDAFEAQLRDCHSREFDALLPAGHSSGGGISGTSTASFSSFFLFQSTREQRLHGREISESQLTAYSRSAIRCESRPAVALRRHVDRIRGDRRSSCARRDLSVFLALAQSLDESADAFPLLSRELLADSFVGGHDTHVREHSDYMCQHSVKLTHAPPLCSFPRNTRMFPFLGAHARDPHVSHTDPSSVSHFKWGVV
ncbi:Pol protein, partial [Globisporangium splendens]